ncbi:Uma2 family endonuclease [Streptomyces sp. NPDC093801]|uniref:Uma2 family endonuclease n=1 Tax=Streptomyces sp. NPDC093801 TaxID=3155203 RepID=UPI00344E2422
MGWPSSSYPGSGRLLPSQLITLVVEVVSRTSADRDYVAKRSIHAAGRVPACLVVDPVVGQCVLPAIPVGEGDDADHRAQRVTKFGEPLPPGPLGIELDTGDFGTFQGVRPHRRP